jgi:hypothetical protein
LRNCTAAPVTRKATNTNIAVITATARGSSRGDEEGDCVLGGTSSNGVLRLRGRRLEREALGCGTSIMPGGDVLPGIDAT